MHGEFKIVILKQAKNDADKIKSVPALKNNVDKLIEVISQDPFQTPPPYEKLRGLMDGFYSRRINIKHRLVYDVDTEKKIVRIISMWSHYENI